MVIGLPIVKGEDRAKKTIVVVSCITYQNGIGDETGSLLVLWLSILRSLL
jgi:hypothetical protein